MDIFALTLFLANTATLFVIVFGIFLPFMLACLAFICLGVELHYCELTRLTSEDWPEPTYTTRVPLGETSPIWEQVQPEWRAA